MQFFDRIDSLIDADDCRAAIEEARALLLQLEQRSDALAHAIDDLLLDLMTLASLLNVTDAALNLWRERLPADGWRRSDSCRKESFPPGRNNSQSLLAKRRSHCVPHSDEGD
ncbi:MAG: hypothetical protein EOS17_32660 [Mesorhizobium sp.]|nr:MAG: hypothetical protein EOS17_32660 [Mesorhizobium sp.]